MRLKHTVLATEMTLAETAVSYDALCLILAVLEVAANLLRCATSDGQGHVKCAFAGDIII